MGTFDENMCDKFDVCDSCCVCVMIRAGRRIRIVAFVFALFDSFGAIEAMYMNIIIIPPVYVMIRTAVSHRDPVCIFIASAVDSDVAISVTDMVVGYGKISIRVAVAAAAIVTFCIFLFVGLVYKTSCFLCFEDGLFFLCFFGWAVLFCFF
jgi:hypothetical protein